MVLGKLCHVKQWPNQSSYTSNHLIAKRDEYPCHAKQWPTPTSKYAGGGNMLYKIKDYRLTSLSNQVVVVGGRCILER